MALECVRFKKNKTTEVVGIMVREKNGKRHRATLSDCTCEGYYAHLFLIPNAELEKRLSV